MQHVITQSMNLTPQAVYHSLSVYQKSFGSDDFFCNSALSFSLQGPLVSLICLNCSDKEVDEFLSRQPYSNLEIVRTTANDSFEDITQYISTTKSKYLCFYEPNHFYDSSKIFHMVYTLEQSPSIDILITARQFIDSIGTVIAPSELLYPDIDKNTAINGTLLLQYSINEHKNFFGNLSTLMATTKHAKNISLDMPNSEINTTNSLSFLFHLLLADESICWITLLFLLYSNLMRKTPIHKKLMKNWPFLLPPNTLSLFLLFGKKKLRPAYHSSSPK